MDALTEHLDRKLRQWRPEMAELVRERIADIIEAADHECLDSIRSRDIEQEVMDIVDALPNA